jgi:DNA-binding transcriptional MocR family regulator
MVRSESEDQHVNRAHGVDVLGNWAAGPGPLHTKLADGIRAAIERGELRIGTRLLPERKFAKQISVSRSTVFAAWDQLKREGWLESRRGSGTWVRLPDSVGRPGSGVDSMTSLRGIFQRGDDSEPVDFTTAQLEGTQAIEDVLAELAAEGLGSLLARQQLSPQGLEELREVVAERFAQEGVPTRPAEILITTGYQQAISLVAALFVRAGDTVVVENPTSLGALDALRAVGARMRGVTVEDEGLVVDELVELMGTTAPRLVYLIPTFHNPTGSVLAGLHRRRIARLAGELGIPVVEDLSHATIRFEEPPPPVAHYEPGGPIITVGSMSKLFWSGLRIGWVRASEQVIARLGRIKTVADLGTPLLSQLVAVRLLDRYDEVVREREQQVPARRTRLEEGLRAELPDWEWTSPRGGLALWVRIPRGTAGAFAQLALRYGVVALPGTLLSVTDGHEDRLRLCYHLPPAMIDQGVDRLRIAWAEYQRRAT